MPKLNDTQKSLIILGGGGLLAIACGVFIYFDFEEKGKVEEEIASTKQMKEANEAEIKKIPDLRNNVVAYRKAVTESAKILPTADDINNFIRDLSQLEKEVGITIRTLPNYNPSAYKNVASISRIPLKLQITASTRAFLRFLNQLENRERLITVTSFRVNPSGNEPKPGQEAEHDVGIEFELYRYDPKASRESEFPIKPVEVSQLEDSKEVKDIVASKAKPTGIERYQLLPGRDSRRDLFLDPRRRVVVDKMAPDAEGEKREIEVATLETLKLQLEKCLLEGQTYRNAEQAKDFLRMAAAKRNFLKASEELAENLQKVSKNSPEFKSRDLQDRYLAEVKRPYEKLMQDYADLMGPDGQDGKAGQFRLTEATALGLRKEMKDLMDKRMFAEAAEKAAVIETLVRDAGKKIDDAARAPIEEVRGMAEHARYQVMLSQKKIEVQGIVKMERTSAAIVNGRTLFPNKTFDRDTIFLRVEEGRKGEGNRLIFSILGHEVDYIQKPPELQPMGIETLRQE